MASTHVDVIAARGATWDAHKSRLLWAAKDVKDAAKTDSAEAVQKVLDGFMDKFGREPDGYGALFMEDLATKIAQVGISTTHHHIH
jgi:hypothetical protein